MTKFDNMNVTELKAEAKKRGAVGYSAMCKQELVDMLTSGKIPMTETSRMKASCAGWVDEIVDDMLKKDNSKL